MNCPYCNKPLYHPIGKPTLSCANWDCMATDNIIGNHSAWEKIIELKSQLERTRKALDVAVDALKVYANPENWDFEHFYSLDTYDIAGDALEQITALEQKELDNV